MFTDTTATSFSNTQDKQLPEMQRDGSQFNFAKRFAREFVNKWCIFMGFDAYKLLSLPKFFELTIIDGT